MGGYTTVWRHWTLGLVAPSLPVYDIDVLVKCGFRCGVWHGLPRFGVAASCAEGALRSPSPGGERGIPHLAPPWCPRGGCNLGGWGWCGAESVFPGAQDAMFVRGERHVRVTTAAVVVAHTFEVVTQTEQAAVIRMWHWCANCLLRLLHGLPNSEPRADLEVGVGVGFCNTTCDVTVYVSPHLCAVDVL